MKINSRIVLPAICLALSGLTAIAAEELVPLKPALPEPAFVGTPKNDTAETKDVESSKLAKPLLIPKDAANIAPKATITTSDTHASPRMLAQIIDGDKEARESSVVLLRKGPQYIQFDLGKPFELYAIVIWHAHDTAKVYHSVVVQVADDADFTKNVRTLFNNDKANADGRGVGTDREYFESYVGKTIDAKGDKAQFVRLYSKGSTESALNEYTEVEIYGRPPK